MSCNRLVDAATQLSVHGILCLQSPRSTSLLAYQIEPQVPGYPFRLFRCRATRYLEQPVKHDVTHHITATGPPIHARIRPFAPERLRIARQEFEHMMQLGIIQPSSSNWSSPLHMVPKVIGDRVAIIELSMAALSLTATQSHIFRTSPPPSMGPQSSPRSTSSVRTTRSLSNLWTFQRQPLRPRLVCLSSVVCLLGYETQHRLSSALWIEYSAAYVSATHTSTTFL